MILADYLHNLDPNLLELSSKIKVRWYGVAYVVGFLCGYWGMVRLARRGIGVMKENEIGDFITYAALFGVMLGGRLGYMLFYDWDNFIANPLRLFYMTDGGMSAHGGILGLFFFTLYYALRHHKSWPGVGDNLCCVSPLGILFGRLANFINGELYGHPVAADHPFAVRFPYEIHEFEAQATGRMEEVRALLPSAPVDAQADYFIAAARQDPEFAAKLKPLLTPRHPSQLYEAALEGLALFLILYWIRVRWPKAPHGMVTGFFFLFYAAFRMFIETYYRVGDGVILGMSRGFFYSIFIAAMGVVFLVYAALTKNRSR